MELEKNVEGGVDSEENDRIDIAGVMGNQRRLVIVTESYKTEDDVFWARDEGRQTVWRKR